MLQTYDGDFNGPTVSNVPNDVYAFKRFVNSQQKKMKARPSTQGRRVMIGGGMGSLTVQGYIAQPLHSSKGTFTKKKSKSRRNKRQSGRMTH